MNPSCFCLFSLQSPVSKLIHSNSFNSVSRQFIKPAILSSQSPHDFILQNTHQYKIKISSFAISNEHTPSLIGYTQRSMVTSPHHKNCPPLPPSPSFLPRTHGPPRCPSCSYVFRQQSRIRSYRQILDRNVCFQCQ